jgi:hypothetical protein
VLGKEGGTWNWRKNLKEAASLILPETKKQALTQSLLNVGMPIAYHGSPHRFEKFSTAKIGTGQGAQAYGHGLYFAENPKVAKEYSRILSSEKPTYFLRGKEVPVGTVENHAVGLVHDVGVKEARRLSQEWAKLPQMGERGDYYKELNSFVKQISSKAEIKISRANTYKVNIKPPAEKFLDWDKPLSQQPKELVDAITELKNKHNVLGRGSYTGADFTWYSGEPRDGASIYQALSNLLGSDKAASEFLNSKGIPGIRYLDQGSRIPPKTADKIYELEQRVNKLKAMRPDDPYVKKQLPVWEKQLQEQKILREKYKPTYNYVVFNEKDIEILGKQ